jgi:hypothetical protein
MALAKFSAWKSLTLEKEGWEMSWKDRRDERSYRPNNITILGNHEMKEIPPLRHNFIGDLLLEFSEQMNGTNTVAILKIFEGFQLRRFHFLEDSSFQFFLQTQI